MVTSTGTEEQFRSVQSLSRIQLFETPWTLACQASLSIINSRRLPKFMPIESVMPSNHLILCLPLLLLPSIFPSIMVSSNKSAFCIRWLKSWSFSFNISWTVEQHVTKSNTTQEFVKTLQKLGTQENFLILIKGT